MYSLPGYETMVDDGIRMSAYAAALRAVVKPGSVVIDIGAGTGVMSLLACQFGARRVYAIEPNDAVVIARQNAVDNGMADRITCLQGLSTEVSLPEKADVVVADLRGILPLFRANIDSLIHAREHLLAPGALIPQQDRIWIAVADAPKPNQFATTWDRNSCGLSLTAASRYLVNLPRKHPVTADELLTPAAIWASLDYATIDSPHVDSTVELEVTREGTATGISMWFDTVLWGDIGFSNGPGNAQAIYGMNLLPLTRAVDVERGDRIHLTVRARYHNADYIWQWDTRITSGKTGQVLASFQQSSFFATPLVAERLRKAADGHQPVLTDDGRITRFILAQMNGSTENRQIAATLTREFPDRFPDLPSALTFVGQVCLQFCR